MKQVSRSDPLDRCAPISVTLTRQFCRPAQGLCLMLVTRVVLPLELKCSFTWNQEKWIKKQSAAAVCTHLLPKWWTSETMKWQNLNALVLKKKLQQTKESIGCWANKDKNKADMAQIESSNDRAKLKTMENDGVTSSQLNRHRWRLQ